MIAFKKVRQLKDGSLKPLFIEAKRPFVMGERMESHYCPKKGFAPRSINGFGKDAFGGEYEITKNDCKMPLDFSFKYNLKINEKDCVGYLDTGAHYVMVDDHSLLEGARIKDSYIESSFTGDLKTDRYEGSISFGNKHSDSTYMLKSVQNMNRCPGIQVFFGVCDLFTERCVFDFENKILLLK